MSLITEFKEFIARGNVVDLATAVVIGGAFGSIVTSLVDGILMPLVGYFTAGVSVSELQYLLTPATINEAGEEVAAVAINYGTFIQASIDFVLIAFVIFLLLKGYNKVRRSQEAVEEPAPEEPSEDVLLLREIRDSLKKA